MKKLLIVIPAYNEKNNLKHVVEDITYHCPDYDYLIVNDGSTDGTIEFCHENGYNLLDLPINLGLAGAIQAGMLFAYEHGYETVMQFDGDGQHKAEYIDALVTQLEKGYDIVVGSRFITEKKPFNLRMIGSFIISFAMRLTTGFVMCDPTSGMRIFTRNIVKRFALGVNYTPEPDTLSYLIRCGARISEVPITIEERISGKSYLTLVRSIVYMTQITCSILLIQWFRRRKPI
ncbi:MAG: glycosyltransferase family 2 protein [Oscillospiraceae bacterium]|nr:glycosyltransferase family 2 protein [Oscillospiraceae bacterium]